jgi:two-component system, response regulator / RNA-binding antiterminator
MEGPEALDRTSQQDRRRGAHGRAPHAEGPGGQRASASHALADLRTLDIVAAVRRNGDGEGLIRELQRTRACIRHCWPVPDRLPEDTDAIVVDLIPDLARRIPWVPGEPKAALVVVVSPAVPPDLGALKRLAADGLLHRPVVAHIVAATLVQALATFAYGQRLRSRIEKLDDTLRAFRSVERAKAIVIRRNRLSESEAYQFLRRQAMDRRTSINAVAEAIIDAHEILD